VVYRFIDCRWSLDDPGLGRRAYLEGHVPGAAFVDLERELAGPPGPGGRHPLPSAAAFAAAMSRAGVSAGTFVVAYGSLGGAERLWWLLRHFGHDACAVVELADWRGPLTAGEEHVEPGLFEAHTRSGDTIEPEELAARLGELTVVDARLPARWRGEPNPVDRFPGRIPGALNVPWNDPHAELPDGEPVVYCGSGITACAVLHRLQLAGREGLLYPGSWSEWEQCDLPRESIEGANLVPQTEPGSI
jgi:thiosulfate/3-mercaptopyruvate sulfurtransferase